MPVLKWKVGILNVKADQLEERELTLGSFAVTSSVMNLSLTPLG